jgi:uncharacterized ferritin-like protein (DUF455 family)
MTAPALKEVRGVRLRADPAREPHFKVVQHPQDLIEYPPGTPEWQRESLHRHFNTEVQSMEIAAQSLADFPDAPWDIRMEHARQSWDEARHALIVLERLIACGGYAGEFPIINYDWGVACAVDTLIARLSLQNRTVEAGEMDLLRALRDSWAELGDHETAAVMDGILADEVQHVRFANRWLKQEMRDKPLVLMQVARAIDYLQRVTRAFTPEQGEHNAAGVAMDSLDRQFALNRDDRLLAGFSDEDLAVLGA